MTAPGALLRSIRRDERPGQGKDYAITGHKVDAIVALKGGDTRQARRSTQLARYLGASWVEIAWALGDASHEDELAAHQWVKDVLAGREPFRG